MQPVKTEFDAGDLIVDRYRVVRILGRGGMGVVYLADDIKEHRQVAVKTLLPQYAMNPTAIRRFSREVEVINKLDHPAVVQIHDAQHIGPLFFYTMEYVDGKSLTQWLQERGRLGLGSTVRVLALLADALDYAHQYTVHRDISPENVIVLKDGSVRLLDFGLAKLADNQGAFTMIGAKLGKEQYKAPEQVANATAVDGRADLYSLGIMFFVLLTGVLPKPDEKITDIMPELPRECDAFYEKATQTLPERRYANAREFRAALMRVYEVSQGKRPAKSQSRKAEEDPRPAEEKPTHPRWKIWLRQKVTKLLSRWR